MTKQKLAHPASPVSIRFAVLALLAAVSAQAAEDRDTLYQVSTIDALLAGVYEPVARIGDVLSHGDFGLGTFEALDGELILLDGQVFRASADGTVSQVLPTVGTPFMAVTRFDADRTLDPPPGLDFAAFKTWMESELPSRNIPYALRVEGRFARIGFRSVPKQTQPYPPLAEVSKQQRLFELQDVSGTLIGFWCPSYTKGVNVPGFHLHFLSADRQHGGHVLDFALVEGKVQLDPTDRWEVQLPADPAFLKTDLGADRTSDLHRVEQGKSAK